VREAFLSQNLKFVFIGQHGRAGEGVVWYSGQFLGALFPSADPQARRLKPGHHQLVWRCLSPLPTLILFDALDKIGRKPIILAGFALAALT